MGRFSKILGFIEYYPKEEMFLGFDVFNLTSSSGDKTESYTVVGSSSSNTTPAAHRCFIVLQAAGGGGGGADNHWGTF